MFKYITFSLILIGLMAANLLKWHDPFLGVFLTLIYLFYYGRRLGGLALPNFNHFWQRLFGPLFLIAGWALIGAMIYYFYALTDFIVLFLLLILPVGLIPYCHLFKKKIDEWPSGQLEAVPLIEPNTRPANRWAWLVLLIDSYLFYYLFTNATIAAVNSPWLFVNGKFFIYFLVATLFLLLFINRTQSSLLSFLTIFIHSFLMLTVALIVYKLGYGFDPFIHRVAENHIAQYGFILPKTLYYLGQYTLVVMLAKLTILPLGLIDKILLPLLEAMMLPPLIFLALRHGLRLERPAARLGSLLFFLIPFGSMIATTPQDLANFFALTLLLFGALFLTTRLVPWWLPLLLTLTVLAIHPLTGLPMLIFYGLMMILGGLKNKTRQIYLIIPLFLVGLFLLPIAFLLFAKAQFHLSSLRDIFNLLPPLPRPRPDQPFSIGFTLIYCYQYFLTLLILMASAWGSWQMLKKERSFKPLIMAGWLSFFVFLANAAFLKLTLTFNQVGLAEQGQYPARLYHFSFYLLLPFFLFALISLWNKIIEKKFGALWLYGSLILLLTVSFYLSYPRVDAYSFSRYFNTSANDFAGVQQIEEKSQKENYLVLSNISFSAAAIQELGFKKYYQTPTGPLFFYALPTGGPLYNFYLKIVYETVSRETMNQAMDLAGVSQSYLVLHDYWNSFKTAAPQAKQTADEWWEIDKGKVMIFRYQK